MKWNKIVQKFKKMPKENRSFLIWSIIGFGAAVVFFISSIT